MIVSYRCDKKNNGMIRIVAAMLLPLLMPCAASGRGGMMCGDDCERVVSVDVEDSLSVDTTMTLSGVTVTGARIYSKVDRQVILPTKAMVRHSSDGYELLRKLSLAGIRVSVSERKITSARGGDVQVRINDVKAESQDILSLRPDEVIRVEYIDNPGVRYSEDNLDAVINYVVRRRYSGYVGGLGTIQAFTTGFNNTNAYFKYNHGKSELSLSYRMAYRYYDEQKGDKLDVYIYPDGTVRHRDYIGIYNTMAYNDHNLQLGYNLAEPDKYNLNVRFNLGWLNNPYSGPIQRLVEEGVDDMLTYNRSSQSNRTPSLDIYYSLNLPHRQSLAVNVVGTYIGTDYKYHMREYVFDQTLEQTISQTPTNDYSYSTDGNKYSLIGEAVYNKEMERTGLSAGVNYAVSHTDNRYTGSVNTDAVLNSENLYAFAQLQGRAGKLNWQAGVGANLSSIHQGSEGFSKWTFRPQLTLSANAIKNVSIRYSARILPRIPTLAQLSDVRQQSNDLQASDGNTGLKPSVSYTNSLTVNWNRPVFDLQVYGSWLYAPDIIMNSIIPQEQDGGSYLFVWKPENQKRYSEYSARAEMTLHAIRDKWDITLFGGCTRYESRGLTYSHDLDNWHYGLYTSLMLGRWSVDYYFAPAAKSLFSETISGGENISNLDVSYKHGNLTVGVGCLLLGYAQGFDYTSSTTSQYYSSNGHTHIKNNGNMVYLNLSYNFSHGRKYHAAQRKLNNSDNDSGIK